MKYCAYCGSKIADSANYCPNCGTRVNDSVTIENEPTDRNVGYRIVLFS